LVELGIADRDRTRAAHFAFEENVGLVPVTVASASGGGFFTWLTAARLPELGPVVPSREILAALLGIEEDDILEDERAWPCGYSAGLPFLFVPVRDRSVLQRVGLDLARWRETIANGWAKDVYVFCHEGAGGVDLRARMFAPAAGITEDPATGSAAAALAGYLWRRKGSGGTWIVAQGVEMGRPSTLHVEAQEEDGILRTVRVGGSAVRVSHGTMKLGFA